MTAFLDRIERLNPTVNAIVSLQDRGRSLAQARERDDELARGEHRGWMHGFPQAIKDLAPAAGFPLTKGSPLFGEVPKTDAIFVERMRRAGAIVIGKTNTPEFGLGSQTYNPVFGTTLNAYDQAKTRGRISGGAAVALALRMLPVADGSDHGGSLRNPAAFNNVFGFRPVLRARAGERRRGVPAAALRRRADGAHRPGPCPPALGAWPATTPALPLSIDEDPAVFAEPLKRDVKGCGLPGSATSADTCRWSPASSISAVRRCRSSRTSAASSRRWCRTSIRSGSGRPGCRCATGRPARRSLEFFRDPEKRARMKPEAQWEIEQGLKLSAYDIAKASGVRSAWYQTVRRLFERYDYLAPAVGAGVPLRCRRPTGRRRSPAAAMDTYHRWMEVVIPATMSGCPAISVPVGFGGNGLPMGMQIVGRNRGELAVLQLAHAYDEATGWVEGSLRRWLEA